MIETIKDASHQQPSQASIPVAAAEGDSECFDCSRLHTCLSWHSSLVSMSAQFKSGNMILFVVSFGAALYKTVSTETITRPSMGCRDDFGVRKAFAQQHDAKEEEEQ